MASYTCILLGSGKRAVSDSYESSLQAMQQHWAGNLPPLRTCMSRDSTVLVRSSSWSASVDLPWSMCAIMAKLRMKAGPATAISRGLPASSSSGAAAAALVAHPQWRGLGGACRTDCAWPLQRGVRQAACIQPKPAPMQCATARLCCLWLLVPVEQKLD